MQYQGWDIQIEDVGTQHVMSLRCWITSPSGEEYSVFVARGNDRHQAASAARAMIDKIIQAATIATMPHD